MNEIMQGDCLEKMGLMADKSVDLIVTDPPYLMNYKSNRRTVMKKFDHIANDVNSNDLISNYLSECERIMKDNTAIYCFCSWHHLDFFKVEFEKHFKLKNILVWNKNNHGTGDLKGSYAPKHEFILFGHKGRALNKSKRIPDVIDCQKINSKDLTHPTEKPQELLKKFVLNNSKEGDLVFDGFAGTGSTGLACKSLNRKFIGCELDADFVQKARTRLNQEGLF